MDFSPYQSEEPQQVRGFGGNRLNDPLVQPSIGSIENSGGDIRINQYETRLPLRMDIEAMLCYLLLPPVGPCIFLILETQNDYVRYVNWN